MKNMIKIAVATLAASALQALAQGYPSKPVHVIITFPAGTATDIVGRVVTQKLSEFWGQPVLAENRAGAGGSIGAAVVAKAAADGYTLLIDSNAHVVTPAIYAKLPYDTLKDFVDISPLAGQPNVLVVTPGSSVKSLADFLAEAKAKPGQINFASAGIGSGTHLNLEKFRLVTGINVVHVPYKGTPEVVSDLMAGFTLWFGLWGPTGMPADILDKISKDVNGALASTDVRERLAKLGSDTMIMTPGEFSQFVRRELDDYARIIKAVGIKPQ